MVSSIQVTKILHDRVGVSSNRKSLNGFRTFCTGEGAWGPITLLYFDYLM
ncbi:hypothetical protein CK203_090349 [Vitis vinifera]|uniref:Uncharacterized protein n=1 Tax=Vitis vinifera TaxID=29760 RepID=A0A438EI28_VITVI|nr:hypothetical protein CK203_090349 [Vitis vinifera]